MIRIFQTKCFDGKVANIDHKISSPGSLIPTKKYTLVGAEVKILRYVRTFWIISGNLTVEWQIIPESF